MVQDALVDALGDEDTVKIGVCSWHARIYAPWAFHVLMLDLRSARAS
eukprot:CAMPEP_0174757266 /NCGR_PEP_ID=MMETSP1094-20130205/107176_1 /TAXON_ID=156173 /ORGANISM="Chrysochromulina brevifilum, Strain UTEX LB 985" /LENGTH=46 /DNA_ID= /DNA_START= /DNA_END= /DNA_ORIENTATION=